MPFCPFSRDIASQTEVVVQQLKRPCLLYLLFYDALSHHAYAFLLVSVNLEKDLSTQEEMPTQEEMSPQAEMPAQIKFVSHNKEWQRKRRWQHNTTQHCWTKIEFREALAVKHFKTLTVGVTILTLFSEPSAGFCSLDSHTLFLFLKITADFRFPHTCTIRLTHFVAAWAPDDPHYDPGPVHMSLYVWVTWDW